MLVANTAGYIDYVTVKDFVNLQESSHFALLPMTS